MTGDSQGNALRILHLVWPSSKGAISGEVPKRFLLEDSNMQWNQLTKLNELSLSNTKGGKYQG